MYICKEHGNLGEDIVYDSIFCPACREISNLKKIHESDIEALKHQISDLEGQLKAATDNTKYRNEAEEEMLKSIPF